MGYEWQIALDTGIALSTASLAILYVMLIKHDQNGTFTEIILMYIGNELGEATVYRERESFVY